MHQRGHALPLDRPEHDLIVVGGGPVGLHAALKAATLRHSVLVIDKGREFSRASQADRIANIPGNPGISGVKLIERLRRDIGEFEQLMGSRLVSFLDRAEAVDARREGDSFVVRARGEDGVESEHSARALVLATGLVDRKPGIDRFHREGHATIRPLVHRGEAAYCLLCEGWALEAQRVAVVGCSSDSVQIALDIREHFGGDVVLLTDGSDPEDARPLERARVRVDDRVIARYDEDGEGRVVVAFAEGPSLAVEKVFFTLGFYRVNNELAVRLGAATTPEGYVRTDDNSEVLDPEGNTVRGLFAVGDLRASRWKQVVVGWGDAETAVITAYAKRIPW